MGWTVVNMTGYPEAVLAAEAGVPYAAIALVTDYDAGVDGVEPVTQEMVFAVMRTQRRQRASPAGGRHSPPRLDGRLGPPGAAPRRGRSTPLGRRATAAGLACRRFPRSLDLTEEAMLSFSPRLPALMRRLPHRPAVALTTRPLLYWLATGAMAAAARLRRGAALLAGAEACDSSTAPSSRRSWPRDPSPPAMRSDASDTAVRRLPAAVVAPTARSAPCRRLAVARAPIAAGEPIHRRFGSGGAARAPWRPCFRRARAASPCPVDEAALPLRIGDVVDVVAASAAVTGASGRVVARSATVAHGRRRRRQVVIGGRRCPRSGEVAQALSSGRCCWPSAQARDVDAQDGTARARRGRSRTG